MLGHTSISKPAVARAVTFAGCMFGGLLLLTGCNSPNDSENVEGSMNTETPTEAANASAPVSEAPLDTDASDQNTPPTSMPSAPSASNTPKAYDAQIVSPAGYKTLRFGQDITAEIREQFGAKEPDTGDESCYYLSDNTLTYNSTEFGKRASVLYQIIDGKMALIHVQGPNAPFYNGVRVGDSVDSVMATHDGQLDYEVDHYAQNGDYYNLIANVNFTVVNPSKDGSVLTTDNIKMTNDTDTLPIQVEYHIKNGQKLSQNTIAADSWSAADKDKLVGEVDSIDIGIPEAIYLIEGCS